MVGAAAFEPEMAQVKVTFTTTEDGFQLPETKRQLLVPAGKSFLHPHCRCILGESMADRTIGYIQT